VTRSLAALCLALAFVLLPLALGPAMSSFAIALGGAPEHLCACGMKAGTCGCPECERRERLLRTDDAPPVPNTRAVLGSCDDHGRGSLAASLPPAIVPPTLSVLASPCFGVLATAVVIEGAPPEPGAPPTPPPRSV